MPNTPAEAPICATLTDNCKAGVDQDATTGSALSHLLATNFTP
jgi:hypothetical protein